MIGKILDHEIFAKLPNFYANRVSDLRNGQLLTHFLKVSSIM